MMFRLLEALLTARNAFADRGRAALTLLGIAIGTGSIVLLASLLHGGKAALIMAEQDAADEDVIEVHREEAPPRDRAKTARALSRADAESVARSSTLDGALVASESSFDAWAHVDGRRKRVGLVSGGRDTLSLYRLRVEHGRDLDDDDRRSGRRVCLIGAEVYDELAHKAPLGSLRLLIDGRAFAVVGVLAKKPMLGATDGTYVWDRRVLIPETTYDALFAPSHEIGNIYVRTNDRELATRSRIRAALKSILLERHYGVLNFGLSDDESAAKERLILMSIELLTIGSGVLALFAAGINIMNVMLVTIAERRREIGLRRALGATRRDILGQFLLEAAVLSFAGGFVGLVSGVGMASAIGWLAERAVPGWETALPPWSIATGLALSLATGVGFGVFPAARAASVSPIEALRAD